MATEFRFSTFPGNNNAAGIISEQNVSVTLDTLNVATVIAGRMAKTLIVSDVAGATAVDIFDLGQAQQFIGDRLTILLTGAASSPTINFGLGFVYSSTSPEVPTVTYTKMASFDFISTSEGWFLTGYNAF